MARRIKAEDVPHILEVSKRCYDEMDFDSFGYRYDPEQIEKSWNMAVEGGILRGYCTDGITGIMLVSITEITAYFKNGPKIAQEIVFHADPILPAFRRMKIMLELLAYALKDLREIGVQSLYVDSDDRNAAVSKMLQKRGAKIMGLIHYMEV